MGQEHQQQLAEQIAAATRLLVQEEMMDYSGHISARLPGTDYFMVQSASDSRAGLEPDQVLVVDYDGNVIQGSPKRPPLEVALHIEILKARPDIQTVLHCHMEMAIAFTMMKGVTLKPMRSHAVRWKSGIPTHAYPGHITTTEQGQELAATLGSHHAALLRSHGIVLVAESVPSLFIDAVHFMENARQHLLVLQSGQEPYPLSEEEMNTMTGGPRDFHVRKLWHYYLTTAKTRGLIPAHWSEAI